MIKSNATIELKNISKEFKNSKVIDGMNLFVKAGEFLVLLGPSGCGKSTTLRMIAGLEEPTSGDVLIDGENLQKLSNDGHVIAMVFQDYALYPNMTVYQNLEYALKVHKVPKEERQARIESVLGTLNLTEYKDRLPSQLSGGQKQRVAVGRGMVKKSKIFLLDEPLSNIDVQLREKARDEIQNLHVMNQQTIVYVTHDQLEAMALGDRIAVMDQGIIQMIDEPENIYNNPTNLFVAKFIGTPQINVVEVVLRNGEMTLDGDVIMSNLQLNLEEKKYCLGIRPENLSCARTRQSKFDLKVKIDAVIDYGRFVQLSVLTSDGTTLKAIVNSFDFIVGEEIYISLRQQKSLLFDCETEKNLYWGKHE
ncbi:ABC transporter ATP-binding protein [Companilactobacillus halodurans]|uniref:ABC transporter ATP-binding protein n=1 Tax=Companilactobacillus halodurans TaxID=2584183 RepID=A0A5P0ZWI4_9LACO|nr:ABC transporter ATP-binding protein [Companilactobacillus halodurans]MQS75373.1 ABC transporter ATP-binding protein [Companilactobacillus halodurans]MQS97317.1 ABC transporter ATP-binding protein [Companilactobacillus halodurans]